VSLRKTQTDFGVETAVEHPVAVPHAVFELLRTDSRVSECLEEEAVGSPDVSWFEASEVELRKGEATALLLQPSDKGRCLMGANIGPFWVFDRRGSNYELILREFGLGLSILPKTTNGYYDIESCAAFQAGAVVVCRLFRFQRGHYRAVRETATKN
jgi:hypothetical protein